MAEQKKTPVSVKKWVYPFQAKDDPQSKTPKAVEVKDAATYFAALAQAQDGFFPLGNNGLWHGGIHFDRLTGTVLAQDTGVRCIADGEVVAYRIDSAYPEVKYDFGMATYSRGFVLVRHRLQLPAAPKKKADDKAAPTAPAQPAPAQAPAAAPAPAPTDKKSEDKPATPAEEASLTFYSLYMHLRDWAGYKADAKLVRPKFWAGQQYLVGPKSKDTEPKLAPKAVGLRVRDGAKKPVAILPRGTRLTLGAEGPNKGYFAIASIISGSSAPAGVSGYVYKKELVAESVPAQFDQVVVLAQPQPIAAGELVGYLGQYQRYAEISGLAQREHPLVHVEVFSTDDVKGFLAKSRARGKELDAKTKTLLVVAKDAQLTLAAKPDQSIDAKQDVRPTADSPKSGDWAKVRKVEAKASPTKNDPAATTLTPTGDPLWVERKLLNKDGGRATLAVGMDAWSAFPLQTAAPKGPRATQVRVANIRTLARTATDDKGVRWWQIDVDTADAQGNYLGWISETGRLQSPWEWPGFEIVEDTTTTPADLHGKQLDDQRRTTPAGKPDLQAKADRAKSGEVFQKLFDLIDTDKSGTLSVQELRAALKKPWLAQALSRLIVRYESEWGGAMAKWDALDPHMGSKLDDWKNEKGRIEQLKWWDKVSAVGANPVAFHFHPVGLVANFSGCGCINVDYFLELYKEEHQSFETNTQKIDAASLENLRVLLTGVLDYYKKYGNQECNIPYIAYILATARLETKKYHKDIKTTIYFEPTTEGGSISYFNKYDPVLADTPARRTRAKSMGNIHEGDGYKYRGRGYVQITWHDNYKKVGDKIGKDLVANPDLALDAEIAAWAAVYGMETGLFTGKKLSDYISDDKQDYVNARRIINGLDQADTISGFAKKFKTLLEKSKC